MSDKIQNKVTLSDKFVEFISKHIIQVLLFFLILVLIAPYILSRTTFLGFANHKTADVANTIAGLTAPIISFFTAFLLYITFKSQAIANEKLQAFNEVQLKDIESSKYIKYIKILEEGITAFNYNQNNGIAAINLFRTSIKSEIYFWIIQSNGDELNVDVKKEIFEKKTNEVKKIYININALINKILLSKNIEQLDKYILGSLIKSKFSLLAIELDIIEINRVGDKTIAKYVSFLHDKHKELKKEDLDLNNNVNRLMNL